jgi:hypothetical protein
LSGNSSVGRAPRCQRGCRGFESRFPLQIHFQARRHSQVARQRSAKPLFIGSNPIAASTQERWALVHISFKNQFLDVLLQLTQTIQHLIKICSRQIQKRARLFAVNMPIAHGRNQPPFQRCFYLDDPECSIRERGQSRPLANQRRPLADQ